MLKPNGKLGILEFLQPKSSFASKLFKLYFNNILPRIASLFSNSKAYRYLPESVENFFTSSELKDLLLRSNFKEVHVKNLTFEITTIVNAKNKKILAQIGLVVTALIWGATFIVVKDAIHLETFPPFIFAALRFFLAAICVIFLVILDILNKIF